MESEPKPAVAHDDLGDLHRGATVNAVGYVLKLLNPVLLAVVTQVYGATQWGVFVAIQSTFLLTSRVALLGFDKAVLWWIPRTTPENAKEGLLGVLLWVLGTSLVATSVLGWGLPWGAAHLGLAQADFVQDTHLRTLRWMALSLPIFTLSEILIHATMGRRKMGVQVLVKGTLVPLLIFAIALALYITPFRADGLGVAFLLSQLVGLGASAWAFFRLFSASPWTNSMRIPKSMVRYALPMSGSEFANTLFQRLDIFFLTALANLTTVVSPAMVGIYGVLVQIGNQFRAIRQAFDPIAIAVTSSVSADAELAQKNTNSTPTWLSRLRSAFNRAVYLVALVQVPVMAAIFIFATPLLSIFGEYFPSGSSALRVLLLGWFAAGVLGLSGTVVVGFGRSSWALANLVVSIALHSSFLLLAYALPGFAESPLTYVAIASCLGLLFHNALHVLQARRAIGKNNLYEAHALSPVRSGIIASLVAGLIVWLFTFALAMPHLLALTLVLVAFVGTYATLEQLWRKLRSIRVNHRQRSEHEA